MEKRRFDLLDFLYITAREWRVIVGSFVIICSIAAVVSLLLPKWYEATTTMLPPKEQKRGQFLGGFSEILAALPMPSLRLGEKGSPSDIFIGILKSDFVAGSIVDRFDLVERYRVRNRERAIRALHRRTEASKTPEGMIKVTVLDRSPETAAEMANAYIALLDSTNQRLASQSAQDKRMFIGQQLVKYDSELRDAQDELQAFQQEQNVISIVDQAQATIKAAAEMQIQTMELELQLWNMERSLGAEHPIVKKMQIQIELREKQLDALRSGDSDGTENLFLPLKEIPSVAMAYARLETDVMVKTALKQFLLQQLLETTIEESNRTSTVQIVDVAAPPEMRTKPKRTMIVAIAGVLSLFLSFLYVSVRYYFAALKAEAGEEYRKLTMVLGELPLARRYAGGDSERSSG